MTSTFLCGLLNILIVLLLLHHLEPPHSCSWAFFFTLKCIKGEISLLISILKFFFQEWFGVELFFQSQYVAQPHYLCQRLVIWFLSRPLYLVILSVFSIFTVILQYYCQHPGVTHHTAEIIWDIVDLPVRLHQWHRSRASFQYHYVFGTDSHATSGLAWSGSEAVMAEWKPFVILTGCRDDLLELAPLIHHAVAHTHKICIVSFLISPRDTFVQLGRRYKL